MRIHISAALLLVSVTSLTGCDATDKDGTAGTGPSQADVNQSIADHAAQAAAHHVKTTDAAELTSGTLDAARLPPLSLDATSVTSGGVDGGVLPHSCSWKVDASNANSAVRQAVCPVGTHPISGNCISGAISAPNVSSQPTVGGLIIADGELVTDVTGWSCIFTQAQTTHRAQALCCNY